MTDHKFCPECGHKLLNVFQSIFIIFILEMGVALIIFT